MDLYFNFNSIKVRLKPVDLERVKEDTRFQFHKGTIKTHHDEVKINHDNDFNSIKVRLKPL